MSSVYLRLLAEVSERGQTMPEHMEQVLPDFRHELPTIGGQRDLLLIPLTQETVDRYTPQTYRAE